MRTPHPPPGYGGHGDVRWVGPPAPPPGFGLADLLAFSRAVSALAEAERALADRLGRGDGLATTLRGVGAQLLEALRDFATYPQHRAIARRSREEHAAVEAVEAARPLATLVGATDPDPTLPTPPPPVPPARAKSKRRTARHG